LDIVDPNSSDIEAVPLADDLDGNVILVNIGCMTVKVDPFEVVHAYDSEDQQEDEGDYHHVD
jgi:hypothetical protein